MEEKRYTVTFCNVVYEFDSYVDALVFAHRECGDGAILRDRAYCYEKVVVKTDIVPAM